MSTLTEFLRARIAEDEAVARRAAEDGGPVWTQDGGIYAGHPTNEVVDWVYGDRWEHIARHDPARVLAECEAKRRLVELAETVSGMDAQIEGEWGTRGSVPWQDDQGVYLLRLLALPDAAHPDYRAEWKP